MSIALQQPSLLLNSYSFTYPPFGGCGMFMDTTWNCPASTTAKDVVSWILIACDRTPDKHLRHVVLNFHGPGEDALLKDTAVIFVGETSPESGFGTAHYTKAQYSTINLSNIALFSALQRKNIGTIWLHSCAMARTLKGKYFCQRMAVCSGCKVVAAEEDQTEWWGIINLIFMARGSIDDYEGRVYLWDEKGNVRPFNPNGGNWS
jgi:hypothetical protein